MIERAAEQALRSHRENDDHQQEGNGETQVGADRLDEGRADAFGDAEDKTADDRAGRTVPAAERGRRQRIDDDAEHHDRTEKQGRRGQRASDEADDRGKAPAKHQHGFDLDADIRTIAAFHSRGLHGKTDAREPEHEREPQGQRRQ